MWTIYGRACGHLTSKLVKKNVMKRKQVDKWMYKEVHNLTKRTLAKFVIQINITLVIIIIYIEA